MNQYLIRINKSRGAVGRGTLDHIWRVFENGNEFLFKNLVINSKLTDFTDGTDYSISCEGTMDINRENSTCTINGKEIPKQSLNGNKYLIRYNKFRGKEGFGDIDHVWAIFDKENKEFLFKHILLNVPSFGEVLNNDRSVNDNFSIAFIGVITEDTATETAIINP